MNQVVKLIGIGLLFVFLQLMLFDSMTLGSYGRSFPFLLFLLVLPINLPQPVQYSIAFLLGISIDILSNSMGLHAFSCVLMMALRPIWVNIITGTVNRSKEELAFGKQSLSWMSSYMIVLIAIHHICFFFLERFSLQFFFQTLGQIIASSIFTFVICFLIFTIFYKRFSGR